MTKFSTVLDHKFVDGECHALGCKSLRLSNALRKLIFAAETSGGTAGRDEGLCCAITDARAALTEASK